MIHIITAANRHLYEKEVIEHFRIRHDIYVGERGWKLLAKPDGLERDQFDNEDATYILMIEDGHVIAGSRLVPSMKPNLMSDVFPHLADVEGVPRDPEIFDWTRIFVVKHRREGGNAGRTCGFALCGLLEYCIEEGIQALSAVIVAWWTPRFHEMGWKLKPLGLPEAIEGEWAMAVQIPVNETMLASTRAFHNIEGRLLVRKGPQVPAIRELVR